MGRPGRGLDTYRRCERGRQHDTRQPDATCSGPRGRNTRSCHADNLQGSPAFWAEAVVQLSAGGCHDPTLGSAPEPRWSGANDAPNRHIDHRADRRLTVFPGSVAVVLFVAGLAVLATAAACETIRAWCWTRIRKSAQVDSRIDDTLGRVVASPVIALWSQVRKARRRSDWCGHVGNPRRGSPSPVRTGRHVHHPATGWPIRGGYHRRFK